MPVIRPGMEAVFRCGSAADPCLPPGSDCAGGLPMTDDVLTPASNDDANGAGGAAGGK